VAWSLVTPRCAPLGTEDPAGARGGVSPSQAPGRLVLVRGDETYIQVGGRWKYLYRAVDALAIPVLLEMREPERIEQTQNADEQRHFEPSDASHAELPHYLSAFSRANFAISSTLAQ